MKGLFIPEITAEMFRNGCLESIEALMAEGKIYDIDYTRWIPCKERLPEDDGWYLCTIHKETETKVAEIRFFEDTKWKAYGWNVIAWMNEPQPYKAESEEEKWVQQEKRL